MAKCSTCNASLLAKDKVKCSAKTCNQEHHFQCIGLSSSKLDDKATWICPQCTAKKKKGDSSDAPVRQSPASKDSNGSDTISIIHQHQPACSAEFLASVCDDILISVRKELPKIIGVTLDKKFNELSGRVQGVEDSIKVVSDDHDGMKKALATQSSSVKKLQSENKQLKDSVKELEVRLANMEESSAKQEQWAKQQNVEIIGIPEAEGESLPSLITKLAEFACMRLRPEDVEFAHRVRAKRPIAGTPRSIIARFRERSLKDAFLSYIRKKHGFTCKDIGMDGDSKVYINEHLTIKNKQLLSKTKAKAKESQYRYVWTKNCRIYVRKNDTSPYILISSEADLVKKMS